MTQRRRKSFYPPTGPAVDCLLATRTDIVDRRPTPEAAATDEDA